MLPDKGVDREMAAVAVVDVDDDQPAGLPSDDANVGVGPTRPPLLDGRRIA